MTSLRVRPAQKPVHSRIQKQPWVFFSQSNLYKISNLLKVAFKIGSETTWWTPCEKIPNEIKVCSTLKGNYLAVYDKQGPAIG